MKMPSAKEIKHLRTSIFRMGQPDFSQLLGSCVATVSRWESGKAKPAGLQEDVLTAMKAAVDNYGEQRVRGVDWLAMFQLKGSLHVLAGVFNFATVPAQPSIVDSPD